MDKSTVMNMAKQFMMDCHKGQFRIGGKSYYTHPLAVGEILYKKGYDEYVQLVGLFHDLLEDTEATEEQIKSHGGFFGDSVLEAVKVLTKTNGYSMEEYISAIKDNQLAKVVKLADRVHNLQSALVANEKFKLKYIKETEEWYLDLAKGTKFEVDMKNTLEDLKNSLQGE